MASPPFSGITPFTQDIFPERDRQNHNDNFIRSEIKLRAGYVLQAEKGCHTQLAICNYRERGQVNLCITNSTFSLVVQKLFIIGERNAKSVKDSNDHGKGGENYSSIQTFLNIILPLYVII